MYIYKNIYFNLLLQVEAVANSLEMRVSSFSVYTAKPNCAWAFLCLALFDTWYRQPKCLCVCVSRLLWTLNTVHLCVILHIFFFFSIRLAAMQLWRRKSMQWVEAPMENSLNLWSVTTPGLSSGQQSVLSKRGGEGKWKGGTRLFFQPSDERRVSFFWWICEDGLWISAGLSESWRPVVNMWLSKDKHPSNKYKFCRNTVLMLQAIVPWCKMKTRNYSSIGTSEYFLEINIFTVFFFCDLN